MLAGEYVSQRSGSSSLKAFKYGQSGPCGSMGPNLPHIIPPTGFNLQVGRVIHPPSAIPSLNYSAYRNHRIGESVPILVKKQDRYVN